MANLKAFALNIAKQIKPDDSIECIAEIIEQQIESVWPMTHQPTVGTGQRETELRAALEHIVAVASGEKQVANDDTEGMAYIDKYARAALAAHEEGGGARGTVLISEVLKRLSQTPYNVYLRQWLDEQAALVSQEPSAEPAPAKCICPPNQSVAYTTGCPIHDYRSPATYVGVRERSR